MYKVCWKNEGKKRYKQFKDLDSVFIYLKNFVYNGEWIEHNNKVLDIDIKSLTAQQITFF